MTPPLVVIASPKASDVVARKSAVEVVVTAGDDSGAITEVVVFANGQSVCTMPQPPWRCTWDVPAPPDKSYTLQASASDPSGHVVLSTVVRVKSSAAKDPDVQMTTKRAKPLTKRSAPIAPKRTPWGTPEW